MVSEGKEKERRKKTQGIIERWKMAEREWRNNTQEIKMRKKMTESE